MAGLIDFTFMPSLAILLISTLQHLNHKYTLTCTKIQPRNLLALNAMAMGLSMLSENPEIRVSTDGIVEIAQEVVVLITPKPVQFVAELENSTLLEDRDKKELTEEIVPRAMVPDIYLRATELPHTVALRLRALPMDTVVTHPPTEATHPPMMPTHLPTVLR